MELCHIITTDTNAIGIHIAGLEYISVVLSLLRLTDHVINFC